MCPPVRFTSYPDHSLFLLLAAQICDRVANLTSLAEWEPENIESGV